MSNCMMRQSFYGWIVIGVFVIGLCAVAPSAQAAPDIGLNEVQTATGLSTETPSGILINVLRFVAGLIAGLAVLMIVVSGIMYITAGGDSGRSQTAKNIFVTAIIGLVVALLAYAIVVWVGTMLGVMWIQSGV